MIIDIKIPSPGESITEVEIANWFVETGDFIEKDQEIGEVESEKATLPLIADESGKIKLLKEVGETVPVGEVVCQIDTSAKGDKKSKKEENNKDIKPKEEKAEIKKTTPEKANQSKQSETTNEPEKTQNEKVKVTPVAQKMMGEQNISVNDIIAGLKRLGSKEVNAVIYAGLSNTSKSPNHFKKEASREVNRAGISNLRKKLSQRLVAVKNETAMLTTFNEADMSRIIELRKKYQAQFVEKHGIKLGFMSFFTKAVSMALQEFPNVNSQIDGEEIISPEYTDIAIAVQTDKGLMVPVLRNAESLTLAEIEQGIMDLAGKARKNRLSIEEMSGGTFTITNGGIFGSMLSTPIINPPQAAILGMHNIIERPVAVNGEVVIKPMMYIALSYDHRIIDGRDSVSFLVKVKELVENPEKMLIGGNPDLLLLDI
jgi:2-oxoglutarate dehydrogenase E2 component (dihydrolipoamide succinyltransferase)